MFEKTYPVKPVVYDQEERRRWCLDQASVLTPTPATATALVAEAKVIEAWLLENLPA